MIQGLTGFIIRVIKTRFLLIALISFILFVPAQARSEQEEKLNIIINAVKDDLFSSWFNGGREFISFLGSEESMKDVNIIDYKLSIYRNKDIFLLIPPKNKLTDYFNKPLDLKFFKNASFFEGDINDFIIPPDEDYQEILNLALQRYKISFPFTSAHLSTKKYYQIGEDGSKYGYVAVSSDLSEKEIIKYFNSKDEWEQVFTIPFNLNLNLNSYQFIMLANDPYNSLKTQQTLKDLSSVSPPEKTLKISFGNLFSSDNKAKHKLELDNFKENKYQIVLPSFKDLRLSKEYFQEINGISPMIAANINQNDENIFKPYIITRVGNINVAVTGVVDEYLPKAIGTVNKVSSLKFIDYEESIEKTMKSLLGNSKVDLIIVLSNIVSSKEKAAVIRKAISKSVTDFPQKQVLFLPLTNNSGFDVEYITHPKKHEQHNFYDEPELFINIPVIKALYSISLKMHNKYISELKLVTEKIQKNKTIDKKMIEANYTLTNEIMNFISSPSEQEILLPDIREFKKYMEKHGEKFENSSYRGPTLAQMVSNILLDKFPAEIAITKDEYGTGETVGKISKTFAKEWFEGEDDKVVLFTLSGRTLKELFQLNKEIKLFDSSGIIKINGIAMDKNLIRGRELNGKELYRIVTTEAIYNNLLLEEVINKTINIEKKEDKLGDIVLNYFFELSKKHQVEKLNNFPESYYQDYANLFEDKSEDLNNQWFVSLKNLQLNYNRGQISNNEKYSEVKDSRVNAPNNSVIGFVGKLNSLNDTKNFSWENTFFSTYNQTFIEFREGNQVKNVDRKGNDDISLTTDLRLKFITVNLQEQKIKLVPFINSSYSTEFKPTKNPVTNKENNRRSELNNSIGMVFYPGIIDEFRVGVLGRSDFSSPTSQALTPGWFSSFIAGYQLGNPASPFELYFDGSYRYYLPSPVENKDQLGAYGELNSKIEIPLFDKLKISFNLNAFVFQGNQELRNMGFGYGFNTFVGLGYTFDLKPMFFSYY